MAEQILQVELNELPAMFRKLALSAHPDKGGTQEMFAQLNKLYQDKRRHAVCRCEQDCYFCANGYPPKVTVLKKEAPPQQGETVKVSKEPATVSGKPQWTCGNKDCKRNVCKNGVCECCGYWHCTHCTYYNTVFAKRCTVCKICRSVQPGWSCSQCTYVNSYDSPCCGMCTAQRE